MAPATPEGGKWSRLTSSIDRAGRLDLASRRDIYSAYQARIYGMVAEELRIGGLPYVRFVERLEMDRLVSASGVTASRAHLDQVVAACRSREIPVLLVGELTSAYTKRESSTSNRVFWTVNKEEYTDEKGKKRTREVEGRAYRAERVQASSEMACELSYRLINVASGSVVGEGVVSADDRDEVDYITWNRRDGVEPQNLRVKDGKGFKRLSPSDRNVMDKRTVLRTDEDLFLEGAPALSRELVASVIGSLRYYTP